MLIGKVIKFPLAKAAEEGELAALGAVLVKSWHAQESSEGMWITGKPLGGSEDWAWSELVSIMSRKKMKLHICKYRDGACPLMGEPGLHISKFKLYEVGELPMEYVDSKRRKEWREYLQGLPGEQPDPGRCLYPQAARRRKSGRGECSSSRESAAASRETGGCPEVSSAIFQRELQSEAAGNYPGSSTMGDAASSETGAFRDSASDLRCGQPQAKEGKEDEGRGELPGEGGREGTREGYEVRGQEVKKAEEIEDRRRRSSSSSSTPSDSSSSDKLPPLQRMSVKSPAGSVLRHLYQHVAEAMNQAGIESSEAAPLIQSQQGHLLSSYYQIVLKHDLRGKIRDGRELETLSSCLDLLARGSLPELGDTLAGRFIAVESAALAGSWSEAQYLEVLPSRTPGIAQHSTLLKA